MSKNNIKNSRIAISSELWRMIIVFMLVITVDARLRENNADLMVTCDDSAMHVQMTFKYPFGGIVFVPEHYYDPTCSYGISPNTTALQVTLTLPHDSCKMRVLNSSNKLIGFNTIAVFHHRMLETVYDYLQNVTCQLKHPIKGLNRNIWREPILKTWISFENSQSVLPEDLVDEMGLADALLLVYHVKDKGINLDMVVMNCIGHDASTVNEKTRFYQLSNPFGCYSETDLVSNFTVFRNPVGDADMIAYASIKNFSMVVRRRLYITCGAEICKNRCERNCGEINSKQDLYFSDIVTKGLVNRPEGSRRPTSLTAFERFDRHRRSNKNTELSPQGIKHKQNDLLLEKMNAVSPYSAIQFDTEKNQISGVNQHNTTPLSPDFEEHARSKRAIKPLETKLIASGLNVIVLKSDEIATMDHTTLQVQYASESGTESSVSKNSSDFCETDSVVKVKMSFEPEHSTRIDGENKSEQFNFSSFLRTLIAIFALICICGACYSLFSFRNQLDPISVSDYVSQPYI